MGIEYYTIVAIIRHQGMKTRLNAYGETPSSLWNACCAPERAHADAVYNRCAVVGFVLWVFVETY